MPDNTARVRITESELASDTHGVLARVQQGVEVIVEQDSRPIAVIKMPQAPGRKLSECIALAKAYEARLGYAPIPDADFAKDVLAGINERSEPLNPPSWD
jgi:antitoxin (DNA-binding transcriptional repressor) of toxin-antitoxin stability system